MALGSSPLTLGPGEPSRPGEPSAPGDPCRERGTGEYQPGEGRLGQRPKWPRWGHWHGAGDGSPHVQTRQGVQPIQGGPWDQGGHAPHLLRKDLACQVHPEGEERVRPETGWGRAPSFISRFCSLWPQCPHPAASKSAVPVMVRLGSPRGEGALTEGPGRPGKPLSPR